MNTIWNENPVFNAVLNALDQPGQRVAVTGSWAGAAASFAAEFSRRIPGPVVVVLPDGDLAAQFARDLRFFMAETGKALLLDSYHQIEPVEREETEADVLLFPEPPVTDLENDNRMQAFGTHLASVLNALGSKNASISIIPARFLTLRIKPPDPGGRDIIRLQQGDTIDPQELIRTLAAWRYQRQPRVESASEFSFRGGILDIYVPVYKMPVRLEFFGNEIVSIREFDPLTQRSISRVNRIRISPLTEIDTIEVVPPFISALEQFYGRTPAIIWIESERVAGILFQQGAERSGESAGLPGSPCVLWDIIEPSVTEGMPVFRINTFEIKSFAGDFRAFVSQLTRWLDTGYRVRIVYHKESMRRLIEERLTEAELDHTEASHDAVRVESKPLFVPGHITRGFRLPDQKYAFLSENDIIGVKKIQHWRPVTEEPGLSFKDLKPGDLVVHIDHGIGRYEGLHRLVIDGRPRDFLLLLYAENQKLYLPVDRMDRVQRYVSFEGAKPPLDKMGGVAFKARKQRVRENVLKLAAQLLQLFSAREVVEGYAFPADETWQREFELGFEYEETPDQLKAIEEVKTDMETSKPMDRLVCGDVGYGKTEVAMRAAFKSAISGKQVAILAPTTILAQQHFHTLKRRFQSFPVQVAMLSRFLKPQDAVRVRQGISDGRVDVVVGTHALLSDSIRFKDLGLLIIDEEHRFGVKHKEKLKEMRVKIDVLTLTATPIPRTLNLALLGLRDISLINTPPEARKPIITRITKFDTSLIRQAVLEEIGRNGQVYFVHNRIQSIYALTDLLRKLIPEARIEVAHGQMNESELEKIMLKFLDKEFDVLVSTTIIESGLDIPSVNTIIINRADRLGLAQLYQLRGRVGRDRLQAYAYLLVPASFTVEGKARDRLKAIKEAAELGSGFRLASRDLEIRGAGDILGANQHGHISAVGFDMYCQLIKEAVRELRGEPWEDVPDCELKISLETAIPEQYIPDPAHRLMIYRQFATVQQVQDAETICSQLEDQFGQVPEAVVNLRDLAILRIRCRRLRIERVDSSESELRMEFRNDTPVKPDKLTGFLLQNAFFIRFEQPSTLIVNLAGQPRLSVVEHVKRILDNLD